MVRENEMDSAEETRREEQAMRLDQANAMAHDLRSLALWVESHPFLASYLEVKAQMWVWGHEAKPVLEQCAKEFPRPVKKNFIGDYFELSAKFGDLKIEFATSRALVCVRRIVSTVEEQVEEPDPEEVAKLPTKLVTRTREIVEWDCPPSILAQA